MAKMNEVSLEEEQAIKDRCKIFNRGWFEGGLTMYNCPICEKNFVVHDQNGWVYKRRARIRSKKSYTTLLYICSYSCCRIYDSIFDK